jgi:hypothetical protein
MTTPVALGACYSSVSAWTARADAAKGDMALLARLAQPWHQRILAGLATAEGQTMAERRYVRGKS